MKTILLVFFSVMSIGAYAHEDVIVSINRGNIHIEDKEGWHELEIGYKVNILLDLVNRLVMSKGYGNEQLYICFDHDYTRRGGSYYSLGYGQFSFWDYKEKEFGERVNTKGLKLVFRDTDFSIPKILNLINCAFQNKEYVTKNQKLFIIDEHTSINGIDQFDTLTSISQDKIQEYLSAGDTTVNRLLNQKVYRNIKPVDQIMEIDYYFQNGKFHFYNTRESSNEWSETEGKYVIRKTYGEDILIVDDILEILGGINDGHFVFINDSVFYYIPQLKDKVSGPFMVDSIRAGRPPVQQYYHEYSPVERFTLFFDNYRRYQKAIFFPDSNLIISNFDKIEDGFINGLFKEESKEIEFKREMTIRLFTLITLGLSIVINIWLFRQKQK